MLDRALLPIALRLAAVVTSVALTAAPAHALYITELMASNASTIADEDGDFEDWLEIHNESAAPVAVGGWYLTDNDGDLTKWQLPAETIVANGYLLVWTSGKDRTTVGQPLHTSFRLAREGEYLALVRPDGTTVEHEYAPQYPEQQPDISYGLDLTLTSERCFVDPTPGAVNDESTACVNVEPVSFSVERGFYDTLFSVALTTATAGATIRYTLDGTEPTDTHGSVYGAPVSVSGTTMLRAVAFKSGLVTSSSVTHTYIFTDDVIQQHGVGLPPVYYGWSGNDWEMDPEVVNDPAYATTISGDLKTIPSLSIVTDPDHLFGEDDGIYSHPLARGVEWERPTSAEFIYPDGSAAFQINAGVRIQGGSSRIGSIKKHSIRLLFKSIYGPSKMDFPLFRDSPVDRFNTITFSARKSKTWHTGSSRAQYVRDTWTKDTQVDMGRPAGHSQHVHLYLNGLYWGLYRATERPDAEFFAEHLGGEPEDWDARKSNQVLDGDNEAWETAHAIASAGLSTPSQYAALQQYVDVENLIDYMIMNLYAENTDWDWHNWYIGRRRQSGAGFQFVSWDAEGVLEKVNSNRTAIQYSDAPSALYDRLRKQNAEFRVLFGDHVHRHFFNGGALTHASAEARYMRRANEIDRAVVGESARWGDKASSTPYTRDVHWITELLWVRLAYFPIRSDIVVEQFRAKDLYPTVVAPSFNQHGGLFLPGFELEMDAPAGTIHYTTDGADPRLAGGGVSPSAQVHAGPLPLTSSVHVKSRVQSGSSWSALNEASFVRDVLIRVTELMYHPPGGSAHEYVELTNVGSDPVDLAGMAFTDGIAFTFPTSVVAPGDRVLVVADQVAFGAQYGGGLPVVGQYTGKLDNGGEQLRLEGADGGAIHDFAYDDAWYPTTDGSGPSLVIRDPAGAAALWGEADGWRASTSATGSPGTAELPMCSDGVDNDLDGDTDFPADDGCADAAQDFEDPACDDGVDNDGDGDVDLADGECGLASHGSEAPDPDDPYLCYKARRSRTIDRFESFDVTLSDAFESGVSYRVRRETSVCPPGDLNATAAIDPDTALQAYQIKENSGAAEHTPRLQLETETAFGPLFIDTDRPDSLLVPAAFDESAPAAPPAGGSHEVDAYKCYRVKVSKDTPKYFPKDAIAGIDDVFESRKYRLKKVKRLCLAASVDSAPVINADAAMLCYQAKFSKFDSRHVRRFGVHTATGFGPSALDTSKEETLCVPARVVLP